MPNSCPKCGGALSLSVVHGLRRAVSLTYAFDCPHCAARLINNYWAPKLIWFRLAFAFGAAVLFFVLFALGVRVEWLAACFFAYIAIGWWWLRRFRTVVYADNRLNEADKQRNQV
jgi:hypothetical protein